MTDPEDVNTKIAFFLPDLKGGGAERVFLDLCIHLTKRGNIVDLVIGTVAGEIASRIPKNINLINLESKRISRALPRLLRYLNSNHPVALFSTLSHASIIAIIASKLAKHKFKLIVRVATHLKEYYKEPRFLEARFMAFLVKFFYPHADEILAVSEGVADEICNFCKITRERVKVIYNPAFTPRITECLSLRSETAGIENDGKFLVLGVGSLTRPKDFSTLLKAFALVRKHIPARLIILGEGKERNSLVGLSKKLGIEDDFSLPGFVDNPFVFMQQASVLVLSSRREGLPNVLIQAMACGCPVVSTDCPSGPREILENGRYGKLVPVGHEHKLAEAILTTIEENPDTTAGIERAKDFSIEKIADQYLHLAIANKSGAV